MVLSHSHITSHTGKTVIVTDFIKTLITCNKTPIGNSDMEYYCEIMVRSIILLLNNSLYLNGMNYNLITPFMMRLTCLEVDECPKLLVCNPTMRHHFILTLDLHVCLLLRKKGIISYLPIRRPYTSEEGQLYQHRLTPDTPEGNPHNPSYSYLESNMVDYREEVSNRNDSKPKG